MPAAIVPWPSKCDYLVAPGVAGGAGLSRLQRSSFWLAASSGKLQQSFQIHGNRKPMRMVALTSIEMAWWKGLVYEKALLDCLASGRDAPIACTIWSKVQSDCQWSHQP